jgi:hypothetical protein
MNFQPPPSNGFWEISILKEMFNIEYYQRAYQGKQLTELFLLLVVFLFVIFIFRLPPSKTLIVILVIWLVFFNGFQSVQIQSEGGDIVVKRKDSLVSLSQGLISKTVVAVLAAINGSLQIYGCITRDPTYEATKKVCLGHVMNFCPAMRFVEEGSRECPRKFMIVNQHGPTLMDLFSFLPFIPPGYRVRVVHDISLPTPLKKGIEKLLLNPLYGAVIMDRGDKKGLKRTLAEIAKGIVETDDPEVVVIWPSGKAWDWSLENGFEKFKPGLFLLPLYAQIPLCAIHARTTKDEKSGMLVRSEFINPPPVEPQEDYYQFVEKYKNDKVLETFAGKVEMIYRDLDNRLVKRLEKL